MKIGDIEYGIRIPRAISKKYHNIFLNIERLKKPGDSFLIILEEEIYESQRPDRILKRNRIELKDEFEYYRNLYFPNKMKKVEIK